MRRCVPTLDWLPEKLYWSGLDKAPSGPREDYSGALRDIWRFSIHLATVLGR
jgi:hypothetical protein